MDVKNGLHRRLSPLTVARITYGDSNSVVIHVNSTTLKNTDLSGHDGGLEFVESCHRNRKHPGLRIVGVADVGGDVVEDDGSLRCCLHRVDGVEGVERYRCIKVGCGRNRKDRVVDFAPLDDHHLEH